MTISVREYFAKRKKAERKKEPRYIAVINRNSCTSCNSCASVCPVDCIYEVPGVLPSESYHQIDTTRCIGCQLCYRVPSESTDFFTLTVCPWNAIDMLYNPAQKKDVLVLEPYYRGERTEDMPWDEMEEFGYALYLNEEIRVRPNDELRKRVVDYFTQPVWAADGETPIALCHAEPEDYGDYQLYRATPEGVQLLIQIYEHYPKVFMD